MTNRASHGLLMALIEIDGLPSYKMVIFHGYVSHNQMVAFDLDKEWTNKNARIVQETIGFFINKDNVSACVSLLVNGW